MMGTELAQADKTADKLDKFRDHLLHKVALKPTELDTLEKYRKCFAWRSKLFSPQQCVNMLMQEYNLKYSQAYQLMAESTRLYGKVDDIDREGTRKILIETLYVALSLAVKAGNADAIIAATRELAKLSRVHEEGTLLNVDEMMPARTVHYTQTNVTINNNGPTTETQEVSHE